MFQPAAFEKFLKFPLHITRQFPALLGHKACKYRVILVDDLLEQRLLGPVTLVTTNIPIPAGHPGRHMGHVPRPCVIRFPMSLRQFAGSPGLS
jgi:hypothetical protein